MWLLFEFYLSTDIDNIKLAAELDVSKALAYKMINQWNEELKAKGYTTVGGRVSRQYYYEKIYGAEKEKADACV